MRRHRIRQGFLEDLRHASWDQRIRGSRPRTDGGRLTDADGKTPPSGGGGSSNPPSPARPDAYRPPDAIFVQRDEFGRVRVFAYYRDRAPMGGEGGEVPSDFVPIDPSMVETLLQDSQHVTQSQGAQPNAAVAESGRGPLWIRMPQGGASQEIMDTVVRMLSPNSTTAQDGLRASLATTQFQQFFQGGKLTQGATQLLPNNQLLAILLPPNSLNAQPDAAKALLMAQGLPAELIQNIPDRALSGALNALLAASQGNNPVHFLQTIFSVLSLTGASGEQIQAAFENLIRQTPGLTQAGALTPQVLEGLAARLFATNNPQILGLNQMVQNSFGQGINQILNSFVRVFLGGALMQSQSVWPQVVPNERMLAELGGLFASQRQMQEHQEKDRKNMARSRGLDRLLSEAEHDRVEAKSAARDQGHGQSEAYSVFLEMDESPSEEEEK